MAPGPTTGRDQPAPGRSVYTMPTGPANYGQVQDGLPARTAAYTEPGPGHDGYLDSPVGAWTAPLTGRSDGTPDPRRTGVVVGPEYRPTPYTDNPATWWAGAGPGRETLNRHHRLEYVNPEGFEETRSLDPGKRAEPDVRRTPQPETRLTQKMSPHRWVYTRPFDQDVRHDLTGVHFSLADHRRTYPIMGMEPAVQRRNTYRADPAPWDTYLTDYPPAEDYHAGAGATGPGDIPESLNRNGRLM